MRIKVHSIDNTGSVCDGPGIRCLLFLQGCDRHCYQCHNPSTWNPDSGTEFEVRDLAQELMRLSLTNRITITGGEPLMQPEALTELVGILDSVGMDIALYTGHEIDDIPADILKALTYLKTGPYIDKLRTTVVPYIGSANQVFRKLRDVPGFHRRGI